MSLSPHQSIAARVRRYRRRRRCALSVTTPANARIAPAEAARWQHLEEREFGRLAQEADHLFDTSLTF